MPRSPEWVQPKQYEKFKWNQKALWQMPDPDVVGRRRKTKEPKEKPPKSRPEEQKEKEQDRTKEREREQDPGKGRPPRQTQPVDEQPTGGKEPPAIEGGGRPALEGKQPGKEVDLREKDPSRIWAHAERIYPPGIGGPLQPRQHAAPERTALPGAGQRALPGPMGQLEQRRAGLAELVQQSMGSAQQGRAALGAGKERGTNGLTIYTGEIVGNTQYPTLGPSAQPGALGSASRAQIGPAPPKALGPGIVDSTATTEIPRVKPTDITTELRPVRSGDTKEIPVVKPDDTKPFEPVGPSRRGDTTSFEPVSGTIIPPTKAPSGPDTVSTREIPVIKGDVHREAIGQRQRQPFAMRTPRSIEGPQETGQLSLFGGPAERPAPLAAAQAGREERRAITPPSMPPGRQVNFMRTNLPKKPGSQGTLFQSVQFKPKSQT